MDSTTDNPGDRAKAGASETIGGILASALNMEDQISSGAYEDYLQRRNWPTQLDEEVFHEIRKRLTTLVEDTKKHRAIIEALVRDYGQSK